MALQASFAPNPLALLAAALACGILVAHLLQLPFKAGVIISLICGALSTAMAAWFVFKQRARLAAGFAVIGFFCAGVALILIHANSAPSDRLARFYDQGLIASGDPVEITGALERAPEPAPESFYLTLRVQKIRFKGTEHDASGDILLLAPARDQTTRDEYEALRLHYGARLRVMAALNREDDFRNPGVMPFTEYLERRGYEATGVIKSPLLVERLDDARAFPPLAWLYGWRQRLQAEFHSKFSAEAAGVLDAALLGNRYNLSHAAAERFRSGGTFHVLVINGLHISFIGGVIFLIVRRVTRRRLWQFLFAVILLWAYAIAVGAQASVMRAALMFMFAALAPVVWRRVSSLNAIGGAALALLVWKPDDLFDPAFQLTILSVLVIVAAAAPLLQRMQAVGAWRPTRETPHPPVCARWFRNLSEALFWSERRWRREMARSNLSYRLFKTPVASRLERLHLQRFLRYASGAIVVSASMQLGMAPLLILYFHRLSPASLALNIFVGVLMAALALVALVAVAVSHLSAAVAAPLIKLGQTINWLMTHSVDPFAKLGIASMRLPYYRGWPASLYIIYYLPLLFLILALARWSPLKPSFINRSEERFFWPSKCRLAAAVFVGLLGLIVVHPLSAPRADGKLHADFLDVGQGDSALLTMPDGTTLLIDGGGRPNINRRGTGDDEDAEEPFERDTRSIGERVVSEYLWWRGLDHVDYILPTHADADHIDGLNDVARNFRVRGALVGRALWNHPGYLRFAETMQAAGVPIQLIGAGDVLRFGHTAAEVIWPTPSEAGAPRQNNESVVLRLHLGEKVFLFTGDVEKEGEAGILNEGVALKSDVVKVAHHGSRTSSTEAFVGATRPRLAVISVGRTSIFGHPNREVVERWRASGAEVLTTGQRGTITITTDGRELRTETFVRE